MIDLFDQERAGDGTRQWSESTFNIGRGCINNCLYCYARANALRFKTIAERAEWSAEQLTGNAFLPTYPKRTGVIMFPSSHDISPYYLPDFIRCAKKLLEQGNHLLIVSKPRLNEISRVTEDLSRYKALLQFRFTIGSTDDGDLQFWEPGAPLFEERWEALRLAGRRNFATSVSIEPMLAGRREALRTILAVYRYCSHSVWVGKMNQPGRRCDMDDPAVAGAVRGIEALQCPGEIRKLAATVERLRLERVRWKESIAQILAAGDTAGRRCA